MSRARGAGPVIIGVSGSAASFAAVRRAVEIYGDDRDYVLVRAGRANEAPSTAEEILAAAAELLPGDSRRQVVLGAAVPALCETAVRLGAVAVVVGARAGAPGWAQAVVRGLARSTTVPVLVVPADDGLYGAATWPPTRREQPAPPSRANESTSSTATTG